MRSTPYHPQVNGMLERFHRTLNTMLGKVVSDNQRNWHECLPTVMAAYRATVHESTGYTPNRLIFGREARLPVDLAFGLPPDVTSGDLSAHEYVDRVADRMREDFEAVRKRLGDRAKVRKNRYDVKVRQEPLAVGQKVWYFYPRRYKSISPKWQNLYTGPFTVDRIIDSHVIVIRKSKRSRPFTTHRDKLKLVCEDPKFPNFAGSHGENLGACPLDEVGDVEEHEGRGTEDMVDDRPTRTRRQPSHLRNFICNRIVVCDHRRPSMPRRSRKESKDAPSRSTFSCDVCNSVHRHKCDLRHHFESAVHVARAAGLSTPRSRDAESPPAS